MTVVADVLPWLMESDPAIRWQVMGDLTQASPPLVAEERRRVAKEGWGARLLSLQAPNGQWGGGAYSPKWTSTTYSLLLLRHFGADPTDPAVVRAVGLVREQVTLGGRDRPYFDYQDECCITAMVLAIGAYYLDDPGVLPQVEGLLARQRDDGGWNCQVGSDRSSFHTTISVLEALLEYERALGGIPVAAEARRRAHEYLLERRLMYSLQTGEVVNGRWLLMSFPPRWHYDVLRGLDYLRDAGVTDVRAEEAIALVEKKRRRDGTWPLQNTHPGKQHFPIDEGADKPSRWNTLRALWVVGWFDSAPAGGAPTPTETHPSSEAYTAMGRSRSAAGSVDALGS